MTVTVEEREGREAWSEEDEKEEVEGLGVRGSREGKEIDTEEENEFVRNGRWKETRRN